MATKTEIYELRKKEENDFYNVEDFNNNMDALETALTEFDDTGKAEGVTSFPEMLTKLVTGNKLAVTLKNLKAGLQFVLHAGSIVNNCVTDNANLPVSAAMAKSLQDQINQANSDLDKISNKSIRFTEGYNVLTSTGSYTVLEDGYIQSRNASEEISTTNPVVRVLINNTTVIENTGISGTYKYFTSAFFPVKVGDIIKLTQATYSKRNEIKLFPIK
mgnify:CR=1 FL=1